MTKLINFVLLALHELIISGDEVPEDAAVDAGIVFDTRRPRKLNMQHLAWASNLLGFSTSLDTVQKAVQWFLAEGGPFEAA